jgi:hypothetical protein
MIAATISVANSGHSRVTRPATPGPIAALAAKNSMTHSAKIDSRLSINRDFMPCQLSRVSFSPCAPVGVGCEPLLIRDTNSSAGTARTADVRNTDTTGKYDPAMPIAVAASPLPMEAKRALRPTRSLKPACPTSARLIAAIPGPISELASPCILPTSSDTVIALAVPKPPAPPRAPPRQDQAAALLTSRGDAMLAIKDISAARKLYERAANLGSAAAAKGLARTYDPGYVGKLGIMGMRPDVTMAASWYDRAAALGDREAVQRMQELDAMAGTASPDKDAP